MVVPTALEITEGTRDSVAIERPHFTESASMMGCNLGFYPGGARQQIAVIDLQVLEKKRVARIWEPTVPMEPKIKAVVMMI